MRDKNGGDHMWLLQLTDSSSDVRAWMEFESKIDDPQ